jgi:hypothetical protein
LNVLEGGCEEDGWVYVASFGEVADDHFDEFVLVGGEAAPLQELPEGFGDGFSVQPG